MTLSPCAEQIAADLEYLSSLYRQESHPFYPFGPHQISLLDSMRAFIYKEPIYYSRESTAGHLTASAAIINAEGNAIALVFHRKLRSWFQPGGHFESEECPSLTAKREAIEETGLIGLNCIFCKDETGTPLPFDVDIHPIPSFGGVIAHLHYDIRYLFQTSGCEDLICSEESNEVAWVPFEQIENYTTEESVLRLVRKLEALRDNLQLL